MWHRPLIRVEQAPGCEPAAFSNRANRPRKSVLVHGPELPKNLVLEHPGENHDGEDNRPCQNLAPILMPLHLSPPPLQPQPIGDHIKRRPEIAKLDVIGRLPVQDGETGEDAVAGVVHAGVG